MEDGDSINFLLETYSLPSSDAVNFELSEEIRPFMPLGFLLQGQLGRPGLPDPFAIGGIYQKYNRGGRRLYRKMKYYTPTYSDTEAIQASRSKFADAIIAWRALTTEQQTRYNQKARTRRMSGYNLFIREYMLEAA